MRLEQRLEYSSRNKQQESIVKSWKYIENQIDDGAQRQPLKKQQPNSRLDISICKDESKYWWLEKR